MLGCLVLVILAQLATAATDLTCGNGTVHENTHCPEPVSYRNLPDSSFSACCAACQADQVCVAFVLASDATCHLKDSSPTQCPPMHGSTSVLNIRVPPPPPPPPPAPKGAKNVLFLVADVSVACGRRRWCRAGFRRLTAAGLWLGTLTRRTLFPPAVPAGHAAVARRVRSLRGGHAEHERPCQGGRHLSTRLRPDCVVRAARAHPHGGSSPSWLDNPRCPALCHDLCTAALSPPRPHRKPNVLSLRRFALCREPAAVLRAGTRSCREGGRTPYRFTTSSTISVTQLAERTSPAFLNTSRRMATSS